MVIPVLCIPAPCKNLLRASLKVRLKSLVCLRAKKGDTDGKRGVCKRKDKEEGERLGARTKARSG